MTPETTTTLLQALCAMNLPIEDEMSERFLTKLRRGPIWDASISRVNEEATEELMNAAANEIERLEKEVSRLRRSAGEGP